jgi:serine phosphatase RsbU (regulator of sigma subunit)
MDLYQQLFFTTLASAFCLLHAMLFAYNHRLKSNLFFALFLFFYACNIFFDFQSLMAAGGKHALVYLRMHRAVMPLASMFLLLFTYSVFGTSPAIGFWVISLGLIATGILAVINPVRSFNPLILFMFGVMVDIVRLFYSAIRENKDGARIMAAGFLCLILFSLYDALLDLRIIQPFHGVTNAYPFGFVCLMVSISVYLARDYARINEKVLAHERKSKEAEIRQHLLEAEDVRKSKELEDARNLQLSMLPKCVDKINGIDICFEMRTAAEVGGDYYDYLIGNRGASVLAIGDATGHGMKAGILVSVVKSLFIAHAADMETAAFFRLCSRTMKQMRLGNLYMGMQVVTIDGRKLTAASAGMPPIFIHRAADRAIREIAMEGMPLGAFDDYPYKTVEIQLEPRDTVLLMSDGLPELFNENNEVFDYPRIKNLFGEIAHYPAHAIVRRLFAAGDAWRKERPQNDDMTFVVLKQPEA